MTAAQWVNEASSSLFSTGSNDSSVRIFDGLLEANDEISREKPSLVSSFFAAPDIVTDKRYSSGLVLDYQQYGGQLIAGGKELGILLVKNVSTPTILWLTKQTRNMCGTGVQVSMYSGQSSYFTPIQDRCPNCGIRGERASHLCQCPDPDRNQSFKDQIRDFVSTQ